MTAMLQTCRSLPVQAALRPSLHRLRVALAAPGQSLGASRLQLRQAARLVVAAAETEVTEGEALRVCLCWEQLPDARRHQRPAPGPPGRAGQGEGASCTPGNPPARLRCWAPMLPYLSQHAVA